MVAVRSDSTSGGSRSGAPLTRSLAIVRIASGVRGVEIASIF